MTSRPTSSPDANGGELDRIRAANERYAATFALGDLPRTPRRKLAVIACMDARLDVEDALGLAPGDAHIIRNAGALATDDAIRSLIVSQEVQGTQEVLVVAHTGCGLLGLDEPALRQHLAGRTGQAADVRIHAFDDLEANLRAQVERIRAHPWTRDVPVRGLIYEVESGRLREPAGSARLVP